MKSKPLSKKIFIFIPIVTIFLSCWPAAAQEGFWHEPVTGMPFIWLQGGCYEFQPRIFNGRAYGSTACLDGFWIGKYEVTQDEWFRVMGKPATFNGKRLPVENVSWNDIQHFIKKLSKRSGSKFRLPTEAEWEFAARAGSTALYYWGHNPNLITLHANINDLSCKRNLNPDTSSACDDGFSKAAPVGSFKPNAWGLHDMIGNVREWCADYYSPKGYAYLPIKNPVYTIETEGRVWRGGGWVSFFHQTNLEYRSFYEPTYRTVALGFRLVVQ